MLIIFRTNLENSKRNVKRRDENKEKGAVNRQDVGNKVDIVQAHNGQLLLEKEQT